MTSGSEAQLRQDLLFKIDDQGHFCRIEAHDSQPGVPDLCYTVRGVNGWIELKWGSKERPPILRQMQWVWFRRNVKQGGNPLFLVGVRGNNTVRYGLIHGSKYNSIYKVKSIKPWIEAMDVHWDGAIDGPELLRYLVRPEKLTKRG